MKATTTRIKEDLFRVLKDVLPEGFTLRDSEETVDENKTPLACVSTDSGTGYSQASFGQIQGKTEVKIDLYLSMGKTLHNNLETDRLQEQIRKAVLSDPEIRKNYSEVEVTKTAALSVPGESSLRILTHDLEFTWTEG